MANRLSLQYSPLEDITTILAARNSLEEIDDLIRTTRKYRLRLAEGIEEGRSIGNEQQTTEHDYTQIFEEFKETQTFASSTQVKIKKLTGSISYLDNAKRNLTQSMTLFQNLSILVNCYNDCKQHLELDKFREMVSSFKIMCSLAESTFAKYKSVDGINTLLTSVSRLKSNTFDKILKSFQNVLDGKISKNDDLLRVQLRDGACELLESDEALQRKLIDSCVAALLFEINEIFTVNDEAGSLENLSRRYLYFKKVLNGFNSDYASFFNSSWDMPIKLTTRFYDITQRDLQILLKRELSDNNMSIDIFMTALQLTLDFEKYIQIRFSHRIKHKKLSACFEPYLSLWINHQDNAMNSKILSYMSQSKLPESVSDSLVVPSSADLFRTYRSILSQTLELLGENENDKLLISLANFFNKWLVSYSQKILQPLLLTETAKVENKLEAIRYTVLLINTADYCSTTIDQLEERLREFCGNNEEITKTLSLSKNIYSDLVSNGSNILLNQILVMDTNYIWREFNNIDWTHLVVEDYSRYMVTLKDTISFQNGTSKKNSLQEILSSFNRDVYAWNFMDKVVDTIINSWFTYIIKLLQPVPPYANLNSTRRFAPQQVTNIAEQLLLDADLLKQAFTSVFKAMVAGTPNQESSSKRIERHLTSKLAVLLQFLKLLMAQTESASDYYETYKRLTEGNCEGSVWAYIFTLKGTPWDLSFWKQNWQVFRTKNQEDNNNGVRNDMYIFQWNSTLLLQFESNMLRVSDASWAAFIRNELGIVPRSRRR